MPRPRIPRRIWFDPHVTHFKPAGVRLREAGEVILTVDEFEAIRLKDFEGLDQTEAAGKMGISQPTFQRLYNIARRKIADALVNGKAIRVEGGSFISMGRARRGRGPGRGRWLRGGRP